jgi:LPXTG-motif cell wall-anchored protein
MRSPLRKMTNPVEMLSSDHEAVKTLFEKWDQTGPGVKRKLLAQEIFNSLRIHATLEEEIFYPAVRQHLCQQGQSFAQEAYREHANIKDLIAELEKMNEGDRSFHDTLRALKAEVQSHAGKEEAQIFSLAERLPMRDLALAMDKRRVQLMVLNPTPSLLGILGLALIGMGLVLILRRRRN